MPVWQSAEDQTAVSQTLLYAHSFWRTPFSVYYDLAECAAECAASLHSVNSYRVPGTSVGPDPSAVNSV